MTAMAWPTESPWVRKVLGVCHVATLREDLRIKVRTSLKCHEGGPVFDTHNDKEPKKLNHPQVRREGVNGIKSRLDHALTSSCRESSDLSITASLNLRTVVFAMITPRK